MNKRAGRQEWWIVFFSAIVLGNGAERALATMVLSAAKGLTSEPLHLIIALGVLRATVLYFVLRTQVEVSTRRARDGDGKSLALWPYIAMATALSITTFFGQDLPFDTRLVWLPYLAVLGWLAFELGLRPGDPITNQWGPIPKPFLEFTAPKSDNYKPPRP
ncbi:DUF805 domain-containing protein [uncultured Brevundimonas sp.]|uniref:DUF805 domain-containing protein n=1 Tax=uncultured Brevundimonas sp. TaxID=213418 RepID=UPI00262C62CA|nr:DUF805 domain-containing protein [uncultured Brevundimonas sp.]